MTSILKCRTCEITSHFNLKIAQYRMLKKQRTTLFLDLLERYLENNKSELENIILQVKNNEYQKYDLTNNQDLHNFLCELEVISGTLICPKCNASYTINDKIPNLNKIESN